MSRKGEIEKIRREIEGMVLRNALNVKKMVELLKAVSKIPMDLEMLRKTRIGVAVNTVRRTYPKCQPIHELSTTCIRNWKRLARRADRRKSDSFDVIEGRADPLKLVPESDCPLVDSRIVSKQRVRRDSDAKSVGSSDSGTQNFRRKSVELLADALSHLAPDECPSGVDLSESVLDQKRLQDLASEIEQQIFKVNGCNSEKKYRTHIRNLVLTLKQRRNPNFHMDVVSGKVSPETVAKLSPDELATDKMKELRSSFERESFRSRLISENEESRSQMFRCHRCGERDTHYSISQERLGGEYEPTEVTLLVCNKCGNRWKSY